MDIETFEVGDLRVRICYDEGGSDSPRDWDNVTKIYGEHRSYTIGDGDPPPEHKEVLERGGLRLLYRWLRRYGDIIVFAKLGMLDHSGISFYPVLMGDSATHWVDYGGWDSGCVGYVYVAREDWVKCCGDTDPFEMVDGEAKFPLGSVPVKVARAWRVLEDEVETYSDWANGQVFGYIIEKPHDCGTEHCPHDTVLDSCWGFIGDGVEQEARLQAQWYIDNPSWRTDVSA